MSELNMILHREESYTYLQVKGYRVIVVQSESMIEEAKKLLIELQAKERTYEWVFIHDLKKCIDPTNFDSVEKLITNNKLMQREPIPIHRLTLPDIDYSCLVKDSFKLNENPHRSPKSRNCKIVRR